MVLGLYPDIKKDLMCCIDLCRKHCFLNQLVRSFFLVRAVVQNCFAELAQCYEIGQNIESATNGLGRSSFVLPEANAHL
jgi:hypothetical protein